MDVDGEEEKERKKEKKEKKRKRESDANGVAMDEDEKEETEEEKKARRKAKKEAKAAAAAASANVGALLKANAHFHLPPPPSLLVLTYLSTPPKDGESAARTSPVIVVTGANGGVGFGICQRLLSQLCQLNPPDSLPQAFSSLSSTSPSTPDDDRPPAGYEGLTLIMACRNTRRAEAAKAKLLSWFGGYLADMAKGKVREGAKGDGGKERTQEEKEYTEAFRATVDVRTLELDLASFSSVLKFAAALRDQVPYVSHLVFNAGVASFERIDWFLCLKQFLTDPGTLITAPTYYTQHVGERSADNLGWVWQSNVFGHFVLVRALYPLPP
ncbi:hypothetical protein NLJ89_g10619 [Agrocybe chaxingu]|uniref:Uncharacterized protein n=1 Tax=Agrocybe chaxingu TaxID=84603 RepID=A0A9W8JRF7_9AGAR|nr:hypothetical protein NLJ89_g10619 [Agrocybe chaxingu]